MRRLLIMVLFLGLTTLAAQAVDQTTDLKKADQDWAQSVAAKNIDQFMSFFRDDAYICDLSGKWMHGKDTIKADWTKTLADPTFKLSWTV